MSNLFKEALADAKKLKEVAEENAKKAILESVTPTIREFIEEQLLENEEVSEEAEEVSEDEEVTLNEDTIKDLIKMIGAEDLYNSLNESHNKDILKKSIDATVSKLSGDDRQKLIQISNKLNENLESLQKNRININNEINQEKNTMKRGEKYYEIDLKMLKEAVEEEAAAHDLAEMYEDDMPEGSHGHDLDEDSYDAMEEDSMEMEMMDGDDLMAEIS